MDINKAPVNEFRIVLMGWLLLQSFCMPAVCASDDVLRITQKSHLYGDIVTLLLPTGIRLDIPRLNLSVLARESNGEVVAINHKKRLYYRGASNLWRFGSTGAALLSPSNASQLKILSKKEEIFKGTRIVHFKLIGDELVQNSKTIAQMANTAFARW